MTTKEKRREYMRRYREKHPEKTIEVTKKWRSANREKVLQKAKDYYHTKVKNNPEAKAKKAAYHAEWQRKNKEKLNAYRREYRKRKKEQK